MRQAIKAILLVLSIAAGGCTHALYATSYEVTGVLLDSTTGAPLVGQRLSADVHARDHESSEGPVAETGPDGSFALVAYGPMLCSGPSLFPSAPAPPEVRRVKLHLHGDDGATLAPSLSIDVAPDQQQRAGSGRRLVELGEIEVDPEDTAGQ